MLGNPQVRELAAYGEIAYRLEIRSSQNILVYSVDSSVPLAVPPAGSILSFGNARNRCVAGQQHWHFTPEQVIVITVFVTPLGEAKEQA
jgi:hypothetical protein